MLTPPPVTPFAPRKASHSIGASRRPQVPPEPKSRLEMLDISDAALAMRAIETAMDVKRRTPILFFSTRVSDEAFKAFLREIGSARYIRKGEDGDSERLGSRLLTVLERLLGG